jgi:hypothetical protein
VHSQRITGRITVQGYRTKHSAPGFLVRSHPLCPLSYGRALSLQLITHFLTPTGFPFDGTVPRLVFLGGDPPAHRGWPSRGGMRRLRGPPARNGHPAEPRRRSDEGQESVMGLVP